MPGGFAEYVLINHDKVFALSDKLSFEEATFTEPTACAVHGVDRIAPRFGDSILMFGAGPTGIILAQLLRRAGAGRMVIADPHADKLDILRKYGFTDLVVMDKADPSKHTAEIKAIMPKGFDIVIDATGAASVFESCFHFVHMGSKIVAYGVCAADAKVPVSPYDIFSQEYTILGSFAQTHCFGRALEYLESGAVQVKELISHELPLEDYGKGLDYIVQKQARKVIIHP
jgi:D-arabinitol dehydrogenase (NADP+)